MPSPPRLTAADAETLLVSAGFKYLDRRGHHRIYGRERTRVLVPFDGRPELHPKIVRMLVESIERSRPATTFQIDRTLVGAVQNAPSAKPDELTLRDVNVAVPPAPPASALKPPAAAAAPRAPVAPPTPPQAAEPAPDPEAAPAEPGDEDGDIDLPRQPKPKGVWS